MHAHLHAQARMRARAPVWVMQMMSAAPTLSAALTAPVAIDSSLCLIDTGCLRWWWCVCGQGLGLALGLGLGLRWGGGGVLEGQHQQHIRTCCTPTCAAGRRRRQHPPHPPTQEHTHLLCSPLAASSANSANSE